MYESCFLQPLYEVVNTVDISIPPPVSTAPTATTNNARQDSFFDMFSNPANYNE